MCRGTVVDAAIEQLGFNKDGTVAIVTQVIAAPDMQGRAVATGQERLAIDVIQLTLRVPEFR